MRVDLLIMIITIALIEILVIASFIAGFMFGKRKVKPSVLVPYKEDMFELDPVSPEEQKLYEKFLEKGGKIDGQEDEE